MNKTTYYILGLSAYFHDSAAVLLKNGEVMAASQEERFSRIKNDDSFPLESIRFLLQQQKIKLSDINEIVFYEKPFLRFERILETYFHNAPKGFLSFLKVIPLWIKEKLYVQRNIRKELRSLVETETDKVWLKKVSILFSEHHLSHAASTFFTSPYESAAILTVDGVGEWVSTSISKGNANKIVRDREIHFPHSLGLFYSAFTYFCGFKVNSGEYKLMGLTSYGDRNSSFVKELVYKIERNLIDLREDGSFKLNQEFFTYSTTFKMIDEEKWHALFNLPTRTVDNDDLNLYVDIALAAQIVLEKAYISLAKEAKKVTGENNLVLAGGVALNCVANEKLKSEGIFENIWIQPACGDAGGALGAALASWYIYGNNKRVVFKEKFDPYLGIASDSDKIVCFLQKRGVLFSKFESNFLLCETVARYIEDGKVIGWFQSRAEWGPRALGNRSILANALDQKMQVKLNLAVKKRESFRPFAPAVLEEDAKRIFEDQGVLPYMLFTTSIKKEFQVHVEDKCDNLLNRVSQVRSQFPAITHIDYSARVQTVSKSDNSLFHLLLNEVKKRVGYGIVINTSFNVRGEPIVNSFEDAWNCFVNTDIDILCIDNFIVEKKRIGCDSKIKKV